MVIQPDGNVEVGNMALVSRQRQVESRPVKGQQEGIAWARKWFHKMQGKYYFFNLSVDSQNSLLQSKI